MFPLCEISAPEKEQIFCCPEKDRIITNFFASFSKAFPLCKFSVPEKEQSSLLSSKGQNNYKVYCKLFKGVPFL